MRKQLLGLIASKKSNAARHRMVYGASERFYRSSKRLVTFGTKCHRNIGPQSSQQSPINRIMVIQTIITAEQWMSRTTMNATMEKQAHKRPHAHPYGTRKKSQSVCFHFDCLPIQLRFIAVQLKENDRTTRQKKLLRINEGFVSACCIPPHRLAVAMGSCVCVLCLCFICQFPLLLIILRLNSLLRISGVLTFFCHVPISIGLNRHL